MTSTMEDVLLQLARDIITPKFANIKETALTAVELLQNVEKMGSMEAWQIRHTCLVPLQLALESKAKKLGFSALAGIQVMFKDERFQTSMEASEEDKWLPSQVLSVLSLSPTLAEDLQVEVIKLLLSMTITASWCTSASTIIKISQVYVGSYQNCSSMVQGAVEAAMVSMISNFVARLLESERQEPMADDGDDVLADFKINYNCGATENVVREVTSILKFLSEKLETVSNVPQGWVTLPLLLEGVDRVLVKVPQSIKHNTEFQELLWKKLCPTLIVLLGQPKPEKVTNQKGSRTDLNRAIGTTSASNVTHSIAKLIYCIAGNLANLVGDIPLLRPVLESLFHKMLVFPLPQHKHDALRVVKELMSEPVKLVSVLGVNSESKKTNLSLMKMLIDTVHQCSHSNDQQLISTSVTCIDKLLASLDRISKGEAILDLFQDRNKNGKRSGQIRRSMTLNPDDDGGSELSSHVYDSKNDEVQVPEQGVQSPKGSGSLSSIDKISSIPVAPSAWDFETEERATAKLFVKYLRQSIPSIMDAMSIWEVDEALQGLASAFCSDQSMITESSNIVLNADGVYVAAIAALKLNLVLIVKGYYGRDNFTPPVSETDFTNQVFSCGLLLYLPPAWLKEVYQQILSSSLLDPAVLNHDGLKKHDGTKQYLISFLQDLEGAGTNEFRSRLMSESREEAEADIEEEKSDATWNGKMETGKQLAADVLSTVWEEILDILSVMLRDQTPVSSGSVTSRHNLALLLATDSAQEDVRRIRSSICISLNGLQRAARLCCTLGLQHLCGSAFSLLARTSCVKEDFRVTSSSEHKQQGKSSVLGLSHKSSKLVRLHAAHVLSMDVVVSTGLEMGSHSANCWKHVLRCCAHISELEHTYFSQGNNQSSLPKVTQGSGINDFHGLDADGSCDADLNAPVTAAVPVAPRINVPALIQQSSLESGWDNSLSAGGVLTFSQASKALCGLSQEVDTLFEDAANKLCLEALLNFLVELGEASLSQIHKLSNPGVAVGSAPRPPTNALHLYRLQQVLVRVVNGSRPMIHLLRAWSTVSTFLVQATGNRDRAISKMAVTCIHEFIVSLVSQREERPHFHINEFVCKTFEDMLCLELCDGDVQDQIVCCICELVEACNSQLHSGWRPLFGALRSVKIEYTTSEAVNEARQRHVAAVMDVFDVYLDMNNITVFASATMDCVLCLLKYVHGPATFNSDDGDNQSDSDSDLGIPSDNETELESLCVPALNYLTRVCKILGHMWQMPACPVFKGAQRIQICAAAKFVDPHVPNMNFDLFAKEFSLDKYKFIERSKNETRPDTTEVGSKQRANSMTEKMLSDAGSNSSNKSTAVSENNDRASHDPSAVTDNRVCSKSEESVDDSNNSQPSKDSSTTESTEQIPSADESVALDKDTAQTPSETGSVQQAKSLPQQEETHPHLTAQISSAFSVPVDTDGKRVDATTLGELDTPSGVLHVWFVLMDGLVSAINYCPKSFQSHTMTTAIDLLKSSSQTPGPEFSMYCVNHLLLPMVQSWLRRGSVGYKFWDAGIGSFKQCCGLVADLVVEYLTNFSDNEDLQKSLQLILKQTMDVFIECVAQPVESISRLGCSCLRHILITAGPHLNESLWQTGAEGVRKALSVSTYNLRLLMSLFHPNSENFYGDIGQVKVATRKDSTVVDGLRLRQMAKQVFLLDIQVSSMPSVHYDTEQHKSFIFLLYPPGRQDSLNPDHISTRVPFRHVVIGLLANQLLLQTIGSVLLDKNQDQKLTISTAGLPGLMRYMSTRNISKFLSALNDIFVMAQEFDARPGLKFLLQKVAGLDVAANLYKQAAAATVFHAHSLLEICANLDGSCMSSTKDALTPISESEDATTPIPTLADIRQRATVSVARPWTCGKLFLPLLQNLCEEMCETFVEVLKDAKKGSLLDQMSEQPIFFLTAQNDSIVTTKTKSDISSSRHSLTGSATPGLEVLKSKASLESFGETASLSRENSKSQDLDSGHLDNVSVATVETVQSLPASASSDFETDTDDDIQHILDGNRKQDSDGEGGEEKWRSKSKREMREEMESKVYTVATDQVIENLMTQYKRHKHQRSMPNFVRPPRCVRTKPRIPRKEAVDDVIDKQQKSSIMKDSEAHIQAWSDTFTAILQMTLNLPDSSFSALLPVIFHLVSQLILHSTDFALRDQLTQCFNRLGQLYDFAPRPRSLSQESAEDVNKSQEQKD